MNNKTRVFLIRHGQPEQHCGKIILGQYDTPLSEPGKDEAGSAAEKLMSEDARVKRIYSSDLKRAMQTAEIIAEKLGDVPIIPVIPFREMSMGLWDGELIEDIKTKFPEEYAKRGEDIRNYKIPGGENFFDLDSRVMREFRRILSEEFPDVKEDPGDLVIVAHVGVISVLNDNFMNRTPGDSFLDKHVPTGSVSVYDISEWPMSCSLEAGLI
jgi:broad specificity phosphatase PhoE